MLSQTGIQARRFNSGQNTAIRLLQNWLKGGSVRTVDYGGRHNVICLHNKKKTARIKHRISLLRGQKFILSVDIFSPIDNKVWGVGAVNHNRDLRNGMWKTIEAYAVNGDEIVIEAVGRDDQALSGDRCYVDLSSIRVKP